ncbi:ATP-binding protein [Jatrophihabitans sp.]|uniref:ATP-binding protein n=1 Tax=Jatrophihabitans sp. TaxID=1932789 RepID=UPI0030C70C32|nr:putative anti-sigma regulatory factor, serine/threonine protein kinase [Jatrophihabitans sp.]
MPENEDIVLNLPYQSSAPALARQFVTEHAAGLPTSVRDDAELLVSELVTNALRYGRPNIALRLRLDPPCIGVAVQDSGDEDVQLIAGVEANATSGRGLLIVDAVASKWGVNPLEPPPGKTVWFEL